MTPKTATALGELVDLHDLVPSPLNPRKSFDEVKLKELAASISSKGIIEPLVVRSRAGLGQLEIVAGERRYRAAKLAGLTELPVIIRTLSDLEVLELIAVENSQRDDLHPLEEADGFAALMKADHAYTPKAIAAKIGKSERYVQQRLSLARLVPDVQKAFLANTITAGHADLMARLSPDDQKAALKQCFHNLFGEDQERGCISVRALNRWIDENIRLRLTPDDPHLELFPELAKTVADPKAVATLVQVLAGYVADPVLKKFPDALPYDAYRQLEGKADRCPHLQRAVVVLGRGRGSFLDICAAKTTCQKHWKYEIDRAKERKQDRPSTTARSTPSLKQKAAAKREEEKRLAAKGIVQRRGIALEQATTQLKRAKVQPGPALLKLLTAHFEFSQAKSWTDLAVTVLESGDLGIHGDRDWKQTIALLKPFGIKLDAIEKQLQAVAQTSAPKPGKKAKKAA